MPDLLIHESEIPEGGRKIIKEVKKYELSSGQLNVSVPFLRLFDPKKHVIEVIIRKK